MTVIHVDFGKPKSELAMDDEIVQLMRERIARKLHETGFHKAATERVCNFVCESLAKHLGSVTKELSFQVNINVTVQSDAPQDVAAAINQAWHDEIKERIDAITKATIAAVTLASYDAVTIMARSDQLK